MQKNLHKILKLFVLFVFLPAISGLYAQVAKPIKMKASPKAAEAGQVYSGKWIWQDADWPANSWACFRKSFELTAVPEEALIKIAVDSKYRLWINEEPVVFEGELKQGPTPADSYYDKLDVADYLLEGDNTWKIKLHPAYEETSGDQKN